MFSDERPIAAQRFNDPIRIVIGAYAVAANQEGGYAAWSEGDNTVSFSFGIAFWKMEIYVSAAREGARYAAVRCASDSTTGCTNGLIATKVQSAAVGYPITPGSPSEDIVCNNTTAAAEQSVTVSWLQHITIQIPFLPDLSRDVTVKGVFRCE